MIYINVHGIHFNYKINDMWRMHRTNGPAYMSRTKQAWYNNGRFHRDDGPAYILYGGYGGQRWYIEGIKYTETQYNKKIKEMYQ